MAGLGERLRDARQLRGVTLAQAEDATKVRQRYLEALEEEDFGAMPPGVHTIGFLRCYASYLGLDVDQSVRAYYRETGAREAPDVHREAEPLRTGFYLGPQMVAGSIVLVVVLALAAYVGNQVQIFTQNQSTRDLVARVSATPFSTPLPPINTTSATSPNPSASFSGGTGVIVDLRVSDRTTFLRVFVDDQKEFDGEATPGLTRTFRGNERIYLQAGDGGSIEVSLNGRKYPDRLGPRGTAIDRTFSAPGR